MTMPTDSGTEDLLVRQEIFVKTTPERAFDVFTKEMATWWPLASHHIGAVEAKGVVVEPFVGGRIIETGIDESECTWGHVIAWQRPSRFVFSWEIDASWRSDPTLRDRVHVEVRFTPEDGGTRVALEHRGLQAYGARAIQVRDAIGSQGGWAQLLGAFAARANA